MESNLVIATWVLVIVSLFAPQLQQWWKSKQTIRDRKETLFRTLMTFRGDSVSHSLVDAINSISTVFHGKKYKNVIRAFRSYIEHTYTNINGDWEQKRRDKLSEMLIAMSESLGFDFDDTNIKKDIYYPRAFEKENEIRNTIATCIKDGAINIRYFPEEDQYSIVDRDDQPKLQQMLQRQNNQRQNTG